MKRAPTWTRPPAPRTRDWVAVARRDQRRREEPPLRRMRVPDSSLLRCMIYSSVAHIGVMIIIMVSGSFSGLPGGGGGGGGPLVVSLVNIAGPARASMTPTPVRLDEPKPREQTPVAKPKVEPRKPAPEAHKHAVPEPVEDRPPKAKPSEPATTESAKPASDNPAEAANNTGTPAAGQSSSAEWVGGGSGPGFGSGSGPGFGSGSGSGRVFARVDEAFTYDYYLQVVAAKIAAAWAPPLTDSRDGETAVIVRFRILREGRVQSAEVETSSALAVFDASAREAILRAQPFPPFPPGYRGQWLTIHLRFTMGEVTGREVAG